MNSYHDCRNIGFFSHQDIDSFGSTLAVRFNYTKHSTAQPVIVLLAGALLDDIFCSGRQLSPTSDLSSGASRQSLSKLACAPHGLTHTHTHTQIAIINKSKEALIYGELVLAQKHRHTIHTT